MEPLFILSIPDRVVKFEFTHITSQPPIEVKPSRFEMSVVFSHPHPITTSPSISCILDNLLRNYQSVTVRQINPLLLVILDSNDKTTLTIFAPYSELVKLILSIVQNIERILSFELPERQSAFLWGPRKSGKTTYLKSKFPESIVYDFLETDLFLEFSKKPSLLREQLLAKEPKLLSQPIILDEVQKIPQVMDEVHWLIENKGFRFILCGSSARKLKRGGANLLGGRAWRFEMFPFVTPEIKDWDLLTVLNRGLIPSHYLTETYNRSLRAYSQDYLKEEIFAEGIIRKVPSFSRFYDAMAYTHGELVNYSNIARDCGVDSKTVREYYQILADTLMGRLIEPFKRRQNRQVITKSPKFYLFDVGVAGAITKRHIAEEKGELFGKAFKHFILMELMAYNSYREVDFDINFWRTKSGLEVDFILGNGEVAIEVKGSNRVDKRDLFPLTVFLNEFPAAKAFVVCNEKTIRVHDRIRIMPYRNFLADLWEGKVIR